MAGFPPCPAPFNLAEYVLAAGRTTPDKIALELVRAGASEKWDYFQVEAAVLGTATGLLEQGLVPGDRVLIRLGNGVSFPIAYLAAIAADLVPVPTSVQLTKGEISRISSMLRPKLVLASDGVAVPLRRLRVEPEGSRAVNGFGAPTPWCRRPEP